MMILPRDAKAETTPATQLGFPRFGTARNPTVALKKYIRWKARGNISMIYERSTVDLRKVHFS